MHKLLDANESRRFHFIKYLHYKDDWIKLPEIAKKLACSERSLKYDMSYFRKNTDIFTIKTSTKGLSLVFNDDKTFRCYAARVLEQSLSYQFLSKIFFEEHYSISDLAELLFVSNSTLYTLINKINPLLSPYGIEIETAPCRIVGNEANIRSFFYTYFYEIYNVLDWPYDSILTNISNEFISHLINYYHFTQVNYSDFNVIRLILIVNIYRYIHNHSLADTHNYFGKNSISSDDLTDLQQVAHEILVDLDPEKKYFPYEVDIPFLNNLLFPFNQVEIVNSYDTLIAKELDNNDIAREVLFLNQKLEGLSNKYEFPLKNKENIIHRLHNSVYLIDFDPRSNHILYNSNDIFVKNIEEKFPEFSQDIKLFIQEYLDLIGLDYDQSNINYLIYVLFIQWDQLYLHLENRFKEIKVVILSDSDISHSKMIKDMLESSFYSYLSIDYFSDPILTNEGLQKLKNYDLVITNFPINNQYSANIVQTENIPTIKDMKKIENKMSDILSKRNI